MCILLVILSLENKRDNNPNDRRNFFLQVEKPNQRNEILLVVDFFFILTNAHFFNDYGNGLFGISLTLTWNTNDDVDLTI